MRVVIQLIADDMSVAEFGDEQQTTSTSAESNVDEYAEVLPRYNRARHRVTDGKFCGNARPQFRVLVALGNCTVGIVDSLGPLTEGFYDTASLRSQEMSQHGTVYQKEITLPKRRCPRRCKPKRANGANESCKPNDDLKTNPRPCVKTMLCDPEAALRFAIREIQHGIRKRKDRLCGCKFNRVVVNTECLHLWV